MKETKSSAAPIIFSILSIVGIAASSILSARAGYISKDIIDEIKDKPVKEKVKKLAPSFALPVSIAVATIGCVICQGAFSAKQQKALAGAYVSLKGLYNAYKNKVKERYGEQVHQEIINEIMAEKADPRYFTIDTQFERFDASVDVEDEPYVTFYDRYSKRYFESKLSKVLEAQYHLNRNYIQLGEININTYYDYLGLAPIDDANLFWTMDSGMCWIDFVNSKTTLDDGMEVIIIDMVFKPDEPDKYDQYEPTDYGVCLLSNTK